jgi:hypothetical protein
MLPEGSLDISTRLCMAICEEKGFISFVAIISENNLKKCEKVLKKNIIYSKYLYNFFNNN